MAARLGICYAELLKCCEILSINQDELFIASMFLETDLDEHIHRLESANKHITEAAKASKLPMRPTKMVDLQDFIRPALTLKDKQIIKESLGVFEANFALLQPEPTSYMTCSCGAAMSFLEEESELRCSSCGITILVRGTIFDEFHNVRPRKADRNPHCEQWINIIQATEEIKFDEKMLASVDTILVAEYRGRNMHNLTCSRIREILATMKQGRFKKHAPSIRKIITGRHGTPITPPQLTSAERIEILEEFNIIMHHYDDVIKDSSILRRIDKTKVKNRLYFAKALYYIINEKIQDKRKSSLLECINLQKAETDYKKDIILNRINEIRRAY
jgi:DNA-directed RNA polymerase subunit RPC12/RpoP